MNDRLRRKFLGIALGERSLLVAEVCCAAQGSQVTRLAEFTYPAGVTLEQGQALGVALGGFLRQNGFSARRAVLGVPAKWLLLKTQGLPPADAQSAAAMLALRAETEIAPELGEMVFDFAGESNPQDPSTVLLMGLPRRWMDRLGELAVGAKLKLMAVTPCAAALGCATAVRGGGALVLSLRSEGAELVVQEGQQTRFVRHLGPGICAPVLAAELRRARATLPMGFGEGNEQSLSQINRPPRSLVFWDDVGLEPSALQEIESAMGVAVVRGNLQGLGCTGAGLAGGRVGAAAVALALPLLSGSRPLVDFLHPRLAAAKQHSVSQRTLWISAAAACVVLAGAVAYADLARIERQVARDGDQLKMLEPVLKTARPFVVNMRFVETFRRGRPRYLACLRDLALVVPQNEQTYLTNFHLQENMKGECAGRAASEQAVMNLIDKLSAGGQFADLKRKLDARGSGPEVLFSVTFTYTPH